MKKIILFALTAVMFAGCSKEDDPDVISLKVSEKTLYFEDEYQIEATSKATINYTVENEYHAEVSETGLVTARFVGETNVLLSNGEDTKNFKVIVKPKSNLYPEPDVTFGDSKSSIVAKFGTPDSETSSGILYADYSNTAPILMFIFDSSNKMTSYGILVKSLYASSLVDIIAERYLFITESDDMYIFVNGLTPEKVTMIVGMGVYSSSYILVSYSKNTSTATTQTSLRNSISISEHDRFKELLDRFQ
jgi:hypothetical protein